MPSSSTRIVVNGTAHDISAAPETPLLYILRNDLGLTGPKFGCGLGQCGACMVHIDGKAVHSCTTPLSSAARSDHDDRGPRLGREAASGAASIHRRAGRAMRVLY